MEAREAILLHSL